MKQFLAWIVFYFICAGLLPAQIIQYEIDPSFNTYEFYSRGFITDLMEIDNDEYLVTGFFNHAATPARGASIIGHSGNIIYNGYSQGFGPNKVLPFKGNYLFFGVQRLHLWRPGGTSFNFSFEFGKQAYSGPLSRYVRDAMVLPDQTILAAGIFFTDSTLINTPIASQALRQLCRIDSTGAPVPDFPMLRCAQPVNAEIHSIKQLSTGKYVVSGVFSEIEGHATNSIALLNEDFTVDTSFVSPLVAMSYVRVLYIDAQDRIWLFIGNGRLNNNPGEVVLGARLLMNGAIDPTFNIPKLKTLVTANPPSNNGLFDTYFGKMMEDSDGTFIVSGSFTQYNSTPCKGLAKINDDGSLVPGVFDNWGVDEAVWGTHTFHPGCIVFPLPDGKIMVGGRFSSFGGEPYSCLVRLRPSGFVNTEKVSALAAQINVFPNPAQAQVTLAYTLPKATTETQLLFYDALGRPMAARSLGHDSEGQLLLDVRHWPAGVYLFQLQQEGKKIADGKFIVTH